MAIMHPTDITKRKHVKSEAKFFEACRDQLSSKFHVFFSVRWYTTNEAGEREDSECDFLIFNPDYGFLCVEVKGGTGIYTNEDGDWFLEMPEGEDDRKLRRSPYLQAEESMRFFKDYYEAEVESAFPGAYGSAVAFPNYRITTPLNDSSPLELTIDMDSMKNLQKRIIEIFRYYKMPNSGHSFFFAPDSQKKFIDLINKRIALSIAAGALIEDKERELAEINYTQDVILDLLGNYQKAFIIGGAGTGKTWIAIKKAVRFAKEGKRVLYLCCNKTLAKMVRGNINSELVDCFDIEDLAVDLFGNTALSVPEKDGVKEYSDLFADAQDLRKYDLILVDEAQDFTEDWAYTVNLLLGPKSSLFVFYDESQNVFSRSFGEKFFIDSPPYILRYNIRNTSNIYSYTKEKTGLGLDTVANQIEGVEPEIRTCARKQQAIAFLDSITNKLINAEGVSPKKITVLLNTGISRSVLAGLDKIGGYSISVDPDNRSKNEILVQRIEDYKGLESDIVILVNHTYKDEPNTLENRALLYTAMTRARFYLYVINYEEKL